MPAPVAKGIIVVASVLVAASIALYEHPQVRAWVDNSRRKIAVALHSLGDELHPRNLPDAEQPSEEQLRRSREDTIRRNRADLIRKAREEGIAVDLDELRAIGQEVYNEKRSSNATGKSFDDLVGSDGRLKELSTDTPTAIATATSPKDQSNMRNRAAYGLAAGAVAGTAATVAAGVTPANPFADDGDHVIFDQTEEKQVKAEPQESRESTATLQDDEPLIDTLHAPTTQEMIQLPTSASVEYLSPPTATASFHSAAFELLSDTDDDEPRSTGTLTPTEGGFSTNVSIAGTNGDIGVLSEMDAMSEAGFSEAAYSEAAFSETGFSDIGPSTPSSWTDVGSDAGSEDEAAHVHHQ